MFHLHINDEVAEQAQSEVDDEVAERAHSEVDDQVAERAHSEVDGNSLAPNLGDDRTTDGDMTFLIIMQFVMR